MRIYFLVFFFVLTLSTPAWARLGETKDQIVARYGKDEGGGTSGHNRTANDWLGFRKGGYYIAVWFFNGVSAEEQISREDATREGKNDPMTDEEIKILLKDNAQGHTWQVISGTNWTRDDGAMAGGSATGFHIISKALIDDNAGVGKPISASSAPSSLKGF